MLPLKRDFGPDPPSLKAVRRFVEGSLPSGTPQSSIVLVASELVTNVIRHANTACTVSVTVDQKQVRLEVSDGFSIVPAVEDLADDQFGLRIVEKVSDRWGGETRATLARRYGSSLTHKDLRDTRGGPLDASSVPRFRAFASIQCCTVGVDSLGMQPPRADSITTLATYATRAANTLLEIAERLDTGELRGALHDYSTAVAALVPTLNCLRHQVEGQSVPHGWMLDPQWMPYAMRVASSRPRVMLTVAANALGALDVLYEDALGEVWSTDVEVELAAHQEAIQGLRDEVLDLRALQLSPS